MRTLNATTRGLRLTAGWIAATAFIGFGIGIVLNLCWMRVAAQRDKPVSRLIRELEKQDNVFDRAWQAAWPMLPELVTRRIPSLEPKPAVEIRREAAVSLFGYGGKAVKAVPALIRAVNDRDISVQISSIRTLAALGVAAQAALPDLIRFFENESNDPIGAATLDLRGRAAGAIAAIGTGDLRAIETLSRVLKRELEKRSPSPATPSVVEAIGVVADENNEAVPVLVSALDVSSKDLKIRILATLENVKVRSDEVVSAMIRSLRDPNPTVQLAAVDGLGNVGPEALASVPELLKLFTKHAGGDFERYREPRQPVTAFRVPSQTGAGAAGRSEPWDPMPSMPRSALTSDEELAALVARKSILPRLLVTLGKIGPNAAQAVEPLSEYYRNRTNRFRFEAARARWEIDRSNEKFLSCLEEGLNEPDPMRRIEVVNWSFGLGKEALPVLNQAFMDADGEVRLAALRCLRDLQQAAVPFFIEALRDPDSRIRRTALEMIAAMGTEASEYIKQVEPLLNDPKTSVQFGAEETLRQIDKGNASRWTAGFRANLPEEMR